MSILVFSQMSNVEQFDSNNSEFLSSLNDETGDPDDISQNLSDLRDGNKYETVEIGGHIWMTENLNFNSEGSYSYNDFEGNSKKFGRLYTWEVAQNVCPDGWHLPSEKEWDKLSDTFGGTENAGSKFMSATNGNIMKSLFGGWRSNNGNYYDVADKGYFWTSTQHSEGFAWYRYVETTESYIFRAYHKKEMAFSVRCVKN